MTAYVALLRAINVGKRRLPMAELRELCESAGYQGVRTYLQSGNIVFEAEAEKAEVTADLEQRISEHCGYPVPVLLRTAAEMTSVISRCPFDTTVDPTKLVVSFASDVVTAEDLGDAILQEFADPNGHERFAFDGRELYLWLPDGQAESPLVKALAKQRAGKEFTGRNWRTVTTLEQWASGN
jgi:uncharacterized protein (DUF1697 family)